MESSPRSRDACGLRLTSRSLILKGTVGLLLSAHIGMLAVEAVRQSPTVDEPVQMTSGLGFLLRGGSSVNHGNPPLVGVVGAIPVAFALWELEAADLDGILGSPRGRALMDVTGSRAAWLVPLGRLACLPFSFLGAWICWRWARDIHGDTAGLLALVLWISCPLVLGHAALITGDVPSAALGATASYAFWRWLSRPQWQGAVVVGLLLGVAELTKFVLIMLYPLWSLQWVFWRLLAPIDEPRPIRRDIAQLALIIAISIYVINLGYGFDGTFHRFGQSPIAAAPEGHQDGVDRRETSITHILGGLPLPLPRCYLQGIYEIHEYLNSSNVGRSYMLGRWGFGSKLFYVYGLLLKMPCGAWILMVLAAFRTMIAVCRSEKVRDDLILLSSLLIALMMISLRAGATIHVRYAMPVLPYAFVWAGQVLGGGRRPVWDGAVLVAAAWSVLSSLSVYPYSLSYFNEAAGGPRGGHAHLIDSNIDWGQDLHELRRWLDDHPKETMRGLAYFGTLDPRVLGIDYQWPPLWNVATPPGQSVIAEESGESNYGVYAVSVNYLRGHTFPAPDGSGRWRDVPSRAFEYFRRLRPVDTAGYSIYIYRVDRREIDRLRRLASP